MSKKLFVIQWISNVYHFQGSMYLGRDQMCPSTTLLQHIVGCWGFMLQTGRSRVRVPMKSLIFPSFRNTCGHTTALGFIQPLAEMSTRDVPGGKMRSARKADNLIVIRTDCLDYVQKPQWEGYAGGESISIHTRTAVNIVLTFLQPRAERTTGNSTGRMLWRNLVAWASEVHSDVWMLQYAVICD
jgi:hypothetical protein